MKPVLHNGACFICHKLEEKFKYLCLSSFSKMSHYASSHFVFNHPLDLVMCLEGKVGKESKTKCTHPSITKLLKILSIQCKEIVF